MPAHNHNDNSSSPMMWLMMLCCLFPMLFLIPCISKWFSGGYLWVFFIGGFVGLHFWMHRKHHVGKNKEGDSDVKKDGDSEHNGSCH